MANQEIYVRGTNDKEARGPFTVEQLMSLTQVTVDQGGITPETYYYDQTTEQWLLLTNSQELKSLLWPQKKKIGFKQKEFVSIGSEHKTSDGPAITVQQFLAAAEGKTEETKGKKDKNLMMMNAAVWGTRSAATISLFSAAALVFPSIDALIEMNFAKLANTPYVFLGLLDAVLGLLLLLGVITLYPFVRFRAVFGLGFLGFLFMTQGQLTPMIAVAAGSVGLYFSTIFLSYIPLAVAALLGLGGMAMLSNLSYL